MTEWIKCSDRMPGYGCVVLAFWQNHRMFRGSQPPPAVLLRGHKEWHSPDDKEEVYVDPTHWMPLPSPPEVE